MGKESDIEQSRDETQPNYVSGVSQENRGGSAGAVGEDKEGGVGLS
jgi:hypothetical protein